MAVDEAKARAKARAQARAARQAKTPEQEAEREKAANRLALASNPDKKTVNLMVGDLIIGKLTVHSSGMISARIPESSAGEMLYKLLQEGRLANVQLAPGFFAEIRSNDE